MATSLRILFIFFWFGAVGMLFPMLALLCFLTMYCLTLTRQANKLAKGETHLTGAKYLWRGLWRITWETAIWLAAGIVVGALDDGNPRLAAQIVVFSLVGYPIALIAIAYLWAKKIKARSTSI